MNVWTGTKWVNIYDGNDMRNMNIDLHAVSKAVESAQADIGSAQSAADNAVKAADSAVNASKVNGDAIAAQNGAITDAQSTANSALEDAKSAVANVASETASIRNDVKQTQDSISSTKNDLQKEFSDATSDLKVQVDKNSAAILKNSDAIEIQERTSSDAIADLKVADGQIKTIASDAQSNAATAVQTASAATVMVSDATSDIAQIKLTASEAAFNATDAKSQAAQAKATADSFSTRISAVESDTDKKLTANASSIEQVKNAIALKADQSTVDDVKKDLSNVNTELLVQAGKISSKAESTDIDKLNEKVNSNSTAIDQNTKAISAKANQTDVDTLNGSVTSNTSRLDLLGQEIKLKVDSSTVNNLVDGKGFITQKATQALIDQKADTINESITGLTKTVNGNNTTVLDKIQQITASIDGVQSTVTNKADKSTVTQLANALQIKMTGSTIAQAKDVTLTYTGKDNEYPPVAPLIGLSDVEKGTQVELSFDYTTSADVNFIPQFDGAPWIPWGGLINNGVNAKKGVKGHYSKVITVGDDSWQKGTAANLAIKCDKYTGTIKIENLLLKKADTKHDVQSTVDMLRDDINLRVTKGDLLSQINLEAGRMLIQSNKIYLDADSVVFGKNSKAFIPSAAITNLSADKITSGTLDAAYIRVINLTADNIHGGTLDVGSMHVKNFSADDIASGTLEGITIKSGDGSRYFQTTKNNIYWIKDKAEDRAAFVGTDSYVNTGNLTIADDSMIQLTTYAGSQIDDNGNISMNGGAIGWPKIIIDNNGKFNPLDWGGTDYYNGDGKAGIFQWVGTDEFTKLAKGFGYQVHLNSKDISTFEVQKDDCVGAYFGKGNKSNEVWITALGGMYVNNPLMADSLNVKGYKHAIVKTSQGYVGINAYETAEYYFGDIGENTTDENGQVVIGIDKIFGETVNTTIPYQVFITPYSDCHIWVETRYDNRFVVKSDQPNAKFGWELKAKRKGYESDRLRHIDGIKEKEETKI